MSELFKGKSILQPLWYETSILLLLLSIVLNLLIEHNNSIYGSPFFFYILCCSRDQRTKDCETKINNAMSLSPQIILGKGVSFQIWIFYFSNSLVANNMILTIKWIIVSWNWGLLIRLEIYNKKLKHNLNRILFIHVFR